jgi:hypothetical protein
MTFLQRRLEQCIEFGYTAGIFKGGNGFPKGMKYSIVTPPGQRYPRDITIVPHNSRQVFATVTKEAPGHAYWAALDSPVADHGTAANSAKLKSVITTFAKHLKKNNQKVSWTAASLSPDSSKITTGKLKNHYEALAKRLGGKKSPRYEHDDL